ncbi:MAG: YidC/Oxa1 family insertase periplasmic-domain containing protein, partial [Muribaculaceae bacterium]|nr:YidC/Oxa1 family insertase periplasmic-domain containing protein [Muribaculaceae bacterium]
MNNNTTKMFLLMGLVFLLFIFINKPKNNQVAEETQQTETIVEEETAGLISANESCIRNAAYNIEQASTTPDENGARHLIGQGVELTLADGVVSGTVTVDSLQVSYAEMLEGNYPAQFSELQKRQASELLRATLQTAGDYGRFTQYLAEDSADDDITLENSVLRLNISPKGGMISRAELLDKKYRTFFPDKNDPKKVDSLQVVMFDKADAWYAFNLPTADRDISTRDLRFTPQVVNDSTVVMTLDLGGGASWGIRYTLPADSYVIGMEIIQNGIAQSHALRNGTDRLTFDWHMTMPRQERGRTFEERNSQVFYKYVGDAPDKLNSMKSTSEQLESNTRWVAFKNQFFSNVIVAHQPFTTGSVAQEKLDNDPDFLKNMDAQLSFDYNPSQEIAAQFDLYIGPNLYPL